MTKNQSAFLWRAAASVVLVLLLAAGGLAIHYLGWSRGYAAGQLAAEGEEVTAPFLPRGVNPFYPAALGVVGKLLLGLLLLTLIGKLIRFIVWGSMWRFAMGGPGTHWRHPYWRRAARWHRVHGPAPPWWGWDEAGPEGAAGTDEET